MWENKQLTLQTVFGVWVYLLDMIKRLGISRHPFFQEQTTRMSLQYVLHFPLNTTINL